MNTINQYRKLRGGHWRIRELRGFLVLLAISASISVLSMAAMKLGI